MPGRYEVSEGSGLHGSQAAVAAYLAISVAAWHGDSLQLKYKKDLGVKEIYMVRWLKYSKSVLTSAMNYRIVFNLREIANKTPTCHPY